MYCGTDNILRNVPHIQLEWWNILYIIISRKEHRYGFEFYNTGHMWLLASNMQKMFILILKKKTPSLK